MQNLRVDSIHMSSGNRVKYLSLVGYESWGLYLCAIDDIFLCAHFIVVKFVEVELIINLSMLWDDVVKNLWVIIIIPTYPIIGLICNLSSFMTVCYMWIMM